MKINTITLKTWLIALLLPIIAAGSVFAADSYTLGNSELQLTLSPDNCALNNVVFRKFKNAQGELLTIPSAELFMLRGAGWKTEGAPEIVKVGKNQLKITYNVLAPEGKLKVVKVFALDENGYVVRCKVAITNGGDKDIAVYPVIQGAVVAPWHYLSGDKVRGSSHRIDYLTADNDHEDIDADEEDEEDFYPADNVMVRWSAASNKYFCSVLATDKSEAYPLYLLRKKDANDEKLCLVASGAVLSVKLAPGGIFSQDFKVYIGPKNANALDQFAEDASDVMHMAWGPLEYLARFLLWILSMLYSLCHSYGVSIILLTLLVRAIFYPITAKGNESMKKMQRLSPILKELREKYKDNPQLLNQKMTEVYRNEGVNPLAGCLPIMLQIPIFFALYAMLDNAIDLRHVPFLWCKDLAAADTVLQIPLFSWNLPINPLVLAMTALMVIQQRMTPAAMDPMQKKMMALMPIVMLIFLYDLPSGLTLYWTVSNIFSIIQLWLQKRQRSRTDATGQEKNQGI